MKRLLDVMFSIFGILVVSPILSIFIILVFIEDKKNPLYKGERVGLNKQKFKMLKLRSMSIDADKLGVDSTSNDDARITKIGKLIRKFKIDELFQLWNVLLGNMSLVGPRPNVQKDVDLYTIDENMILNIKPGITDFASIVFSDEGDILEGSNDPDLMYSQVIRPWKSRLGILYLQKRSTILDIQIIFYTIISLISRKTALNWIVKKLIYFKASKELINICERKENLYPYPPPGLSKIVEKK
jgi:lipopolysaccharide/colanic/teichoic acid biosynthesis glycosyltransferase